MYLEQFMSEEKAKREADAAIKKARFEAREKFFLTVFDLIDAEIEEATTDHDFKINGDYNRPVECKLLKAYRQTAGITLAEISGTKLQLGMIDDADVPICRVAVMTNYRTTEELYKGSDPHQAAAAFLKKLATSGYYKK